MENGHGIAYLYMDSDEPAANGEGLVRFSMAALAAFNDL